MSIVYFKTEMQHIKQRVIRVLNQRMILIDGLRNLQRRRDKWKLLLSLITQSGTREEKSKID